MSLFANFTKTDARCRLKFVLNMVWKGWLGFRRFKNRKRKGELFPAFQFISVTNDCNLQCQGCWVSRQNAGEYLELDRIHRIINESKKQGSCFFGILGGEPLLYKQLPDIFSSHQDCYFQLFTNGILFTDSFAEELRKQANVTPLFSFEGDEQVADVRRGGRHIYERTLQAIRTSVAHGLITGVAISVCKSNIEMALSDRFIEMLHAMGVLYIWYYIYRPVGENPNYALALNSQEITRLRHFLVEGRVKHPVILIDSYWRADGEPFCPAAEGLSHHINACGDIEPCPIVQLSREKIGLNLKQIYEQSVFLKDFRKKILEKTKGCIVMEEPDWLVKFAREHQAINTSNRPGMLADLAQAPVLCSHGGCPVIPEKSLWYRYAKRTAFFGLGAYG